MTSPSDAEPEPRESPPRYRLFRRLPSLALALGSGITIVGAVAYALSTVPRLNSWSGAACWAFMLGLGVFYWWLVLALVPAEFVRCARSAVRSVPSRFMRVLFIIALVVTVTWWPWRELRTFNWQAPKEFDDSAAISNALALRDRHFESSVLYFRSTMRMGFVAATLPLADVAPVRYQATFRSPSDNFRRRWHLYGEPADTYFGRYDLFSQLMFIPMLTMGALFFCVFSRLGLRHFFALAAAAVAMSMMMRSVDVLVTQLFTFQIGLLLALVFLRRSEMRTRWRDLSLRGGTLALAALTMNTLAIPAAALMFDSVWQTFTAWRRRRPIARAIAKLAETCVVAGTIVLTWYEGFLGGLLHELREFNLEVWETGATMAFPPLANSDVLRVFTSIHGVPSLYWLPAAIVVCLLLARPWRRTVVLMVWLALAIGSLYTMPFIFRRFGMYAIVPVAALGGLAVQSLYLRALEFLRRANRRRSNGVIAS